ncbi:MAG: DNA adenine methylase [Blastocatellia bacterium]|nr:DNA adenine methylase [Blastocatellia bacterium]
MAFEMKLPGIDFNTPVFPSTRYMGSKAVLREFIWNSVRSLEFQTVLDAFSGTGSIAYLFKQKGKRVYANDFLALSYHITNATIENGTEILLPEDIDYILSPRAKHPRFIEENFRGLYFTDEENQLLDRVSANIRDLECEYKRSLALSAITRACLKKRPRGIFTYTGFDRYLDGRNDIKLTLEEHIRRAAQEFYLAVFDNGQANKAFWVDIFDLDAPYADLVYLDPPYVSLRSDNDYSRRYHFIEGLARYWEGLQILNHTTTKKFARLRSPFDSKRTVYDAFARLFKKYEDSIIVVSYSKNCLPTKEEMIELMRSVKKEVRVESFTHRYSFGTHNHKIANEFNLVSEYIFIGI